MKTRRKILLTLFVDDSVGDETLRRRVLKHMEKDEWEKIQHYRSRAKVVPVGSILTPPKNKKKKFTYTRTFMGTANERRGIERQKNSRE